MEEKTVNDGKGFFDNEGLCDTLINDLNSMLKNIYDGQMLKACAYATGMAQKILNLKKGIKADMDAMKEKVEDLKQMNNSLMEQNGKDGVE